MENWQQYDEVNEIIKMLLEGQQVIFADRWTGSYVYGSLVWGDFDEGSSDIDTLCVVSSEVKDEDIMKLTLLHERIVNEHSGWRDRIEAHYVPKEGIKRFREKPFQMGNISPGEPLHLIDAGMEWLDEWYCARSYAVQLYGVDVKSVIPSIEKEEFIQTICNYAKSFKTRIRTCKNSSYSQAYLVLSLCRALYTLKNGEQISKPAAAEWALNYLPEYRETISNAILWRKDRYDSKQDPKRTYVLAECFVDDILKRFFL